MPNHYETLGINENATDDEIKKAYRKLSLQFHPDRNKSLDSSAKFQQINDANQILSDPQQRNSYNMQLKGHGNMSVNGNMFGGFGGTGVDINDLNGIFNAFFGGASQNNDSSNFNQQFTQQFNKQFNKPPVINKQITLTLSQVYYGGSHPIEISKIVFKNKKETSENHTVYITIPSGIDENEIIVIRDQGHEFGENLIGDIRLSIKITNDTLFKKVGLDLIYEKELTLKESLCGFSFEIKHLNDKDYSFNNLVSPTVVKPGQHKIIPNLGIVRGGTTGNLVIKFNVVFPDKMDANQIEKLNEVFQ